MIEAAAAVHADPTAALEAVFRTIHVERMQGIPILNPALTVAAVGFAPREGRWLGVMVTPWFMNLMLLPLEPRAWVPLAPGAKRKYAFPAGHYEFIGGHEPGIGEYQMCSLFSPVLEFADMATALLTAEFALAAVLDPAHAEFERPPEKRPLDEIKQVVGSPMSKREFIHGTWTGSEAHPHDRAPRGKT